MKKTNIKRFLFILLFCLSIFFVTGCDNGGTDNPVVEETKYTVTFDFNGEKKDTINIVVTENQLVSAVDVTKYTSKELEGWYYNDTKWDFSTDKVTGNIKLVAKWVEEPTYFVTFNLNGGSGTAEDVEFTPGEEFTVPEYTITRRGYVFGGWVYNDKVYKANDTILIEEENDIELVAKLDRTYTITLNGASEADKVTVDNILSNDLVTLPANSFTKEGYKFIGWAIDAEGEVVYSDNQEITFDLNKDVNLYAKWEKLVDASTVITRISNLGSITYGSLEDIKAVRALYNKLIESEKTKVTNYNTLVAAEETIVNIYIEVLENANYASTDVTLAREVVDLGLVELGNIDKLEVLYRAEWVEENKAKYQSAVNKLGEVLTEVGYSYVYQSNQIQYDQYNGRRNINATPEMATSEHIVYLDCSSYTNTVYNYTFGINVNGADLDDCNTDGYNSYCYKNQSNADVLYYVDTTKYTTAESKAAILTEIKNNLQVGDLLIYRHGAGSATAGHVMMWIGDNTLLHSTGNSTKVTVGTTNPTTFTDKATTSEASDGSIQVLSGNTLFTTSGSRYLFKATTDDTVYSFCVIRMLNRTGLTLTSQAIDRYALSGKVTLEKSITTGLYKSVNLQDELTYKIEVKNYDSAAKNKMYAVEYLPAEVEFVSCDNDGVYNKDEHKIIWQFNSPAKNGNTVLSYKVKVINNTENYGKTIDDSNANVCGINLNSIKNQIQRPNDFSKISTEALKLLDKAYTNNLDFVKEVYKNAWDADILETEINSERAIKDILSYWEITPTAEAYKYLVVDCYGGIKFNTSKNNKYYNNYLKLVYNTYLQAGDIIVAHTSYGGDTYNIYLYLSDQLILSCNAGKVIKQANTASLVNKFLVTLAAYDRFIILRPSLVH